MRYLNTKIKIAKSKQKKAAATAIQSKLTSVYTEFFVDGQSKILVDSHSFKIK